MSVRLLFLTLFTFFSFNGIGQPGNYFEGSIIYKYSFRSDKISNPQATLSTFMGKGTTLYFKEGNYRHDYNGGPVEYDIYSRAENKYYMKKRNNDTLYWEDCSIRDEGIENFSSTPKADTILNITCERLLIQYKSRYQVHYYNPDTLRIDPAWFEQFKRGDEYLVDRKERSIYLKSETPFDFFTLIETAVKINTGTISMEKFKIPEHIVFAKMH